MGMLSRTVKAFVGGLVQTCTRSLMVDTAGVLWRKASVKSIRSLRTMP